REPAAAAVELEGPDLAGQHAGEGDQARLPRRLEPLERQALAGQCPLAHLGGGAQRLLEQPAPTTGAAPGRRGRGHRLAARRALAEARLRGDVGRLPEELARL